LFIFEKENAALKEKNSELTFKLEQSEQQRRTLEEQVIQKQTQFHNSNPLGYVCDHCGGQISTLKMVKCLLATSLPET
jgi:hypothetical protein